METLPMGDKDNGLHAGETDGDDEGFEFRRHSNLGVPTLGERLDSLHEIKSARRMDHFNSSRNSLRGGTASSSQQVPEVDNRAHINGINTSLQVEGNSSVKYLVPLEYVTDSGSIPRDKLIKVIDNEAALKSSLNERARNKRLSLSQRGRRLSMLSTGVDRHVIVSPHKEVPEQEFYKHVGDLSFGKSLQLRQLFNWCCDRTYTRIQEADRKKTQSQTLEENGSYGDPKKITMNIIKSFVHDLKKGTLDIDWEAEEEEEEDDYSGNGNDTELNALFDDHNDGNTRHTSARQNLTLYDDEFDITLGIQPTRPELEYRNNKKNNRQSTRKRKIQTPHKKLPNTKNVENEKNLIMLKQKIDILENDINEWANTLDSHDPQKEWQLIKDVKPDNTTPEQTITNANPVKELEDRLKAMSMNAHLLDSTSKTLLELSRIKLDKLRRAYYDTAKNEKKQIESTRLLRGLASSLN